MFKKYGLTLVELIVSVSVLALLLLIAYTSISRVRSSAEIVSGHSAMRSVGQAISLYINDHNEYPFTFYSPQFVVRQKHAPGRDLMWHLAPYMDAASIRPNEVVPGSVSDRFLSKYDPNEYSAYFINYYVLTENGDRRSPFGFRTSQTPLNPYLVSFPQRQVALIDLDALLPLPTGAPIGGVARAPTPIWDDKRLALHFDFRVAIYDINEDFYFRNE